MRCQSCQLLQAKQHKPNVTKSNIISLVEGALSLDMYETGNFVSLDEYVVKTPGYLPSGFGRESLINSFQGGTIFCDAALKYIHVENQVTLGAGEAVNSKLHLKEWLWEAGCVCVKHYHSDNGTFISETFKDACKEEKQNQSFSGVRVQHQNAEAECAIQTIMYMAQSCLIHTALLWGEDGADDF